MLRAWFFMVFLKFRWGIYNVHGQIEKCEKEAPAAAA